MHSDIKNVAHNNGLTSEEVESMVMFFTKSLLPIKAENQLTIQQKEKLEQVKEASPLVGIMHSLKEEFHLLFESSQDVGSGTKRANCLVAEG